MKTAESAVIALETLDAPWDEPLAAADSAIDADWSASDAVAFPRAIVPVDLATQNQYVRATGAWPAIGYDGFALKFHGQCVVSHPALAACLRSPECLEDLADAAARQAAPMSEFETFADAAARSSAATVKRYKLGIARQLAAIDGHELQTAARTLLACEALRERVSAAKARHEAHAQLELARIETERRAVARAVIDRTVERVRAAAAEAEDARLKALLSAESYRQVKAAALVERLRLSGRKELRVGAERALFTIDDLANTAPAMSLEQLGLYEAALAQHEAER